MMIRTRDFALFVAALLFLLIGTFNTLASQLSGDSNVQTANVVNIPINSEVILSAESVETKPDRDSIISRLQSKLAAGLGTEKAEPILTYMGEKDDISSNSNQGLKLCPSEELVTLTELNWPTRAVIELVEGVRVVKSKDGQTLMQLPITQDRNQYDTCLASDVIGVGIDGTLLRNNQLSQFSNVSTGQLVGYARDGFPIYGAALGDSVDSCGGSTVDGRYGYRLNSQSNYLITCYSGTPVKFIE